ncbi:methyltransferase [Achromobacter ruhlandii]|uniref:methyltransferase n=1 Tax=Achromobacter ruhlandii TaxID=72557 RepID=UPI003B9E0488
MTINPTTSTPAERAARRARILGGTVPRRTVQHFVADQLFVSGPRLSAQAARLAAVQPGHRVLDPSAGTGDLLAAVATSCPAAMLAAIDIEARLAPALRARLPGLQLTVADFLDCTPEAFGLVDRIVMNPPFRNGADIAHIEHGLRFLAPGGRMVAICASGPRQHAALRPRVAAAGGHWEELPSDTFRHAGTSVRTAIFVLDQ